MRRKEIEIPPEYQTSDLTELKRAALKNMDLELVQCLARYIENSKGYTVYYARVSETIIRTSTGEEVGFDSLPIVKDELVFHVWCVGWPYLLTSESSQPKPGELYSLVLFDPLTRPRRSKIVIKEVPDETTFPLPINFDWDEVCLNYIRGLINEGNDEMQHLIYEPNRCRRFCGNTKKKTYHWVAKNGAKMIGISKPEEGVEYTITEFW